MNKKILLLILGLILGLSGTIQAKKITRIALMNPSTGALNNALNLVNRKYIYADSIIIVGLLHESQKETIVASKEFVRKNNIRNVEFFVIKGDISLKELFQKNACSGDFRKIFETTDALIRFGGDDIPPSIYGEKMFLNTEIYPKSMNWQISLFYHFLGGSQSVDSRPFLAEKPSYPILGVCLGMQMKNVAAGGTMYQDIPFQIYNITTFEDLNKLGNDNIHRNFWEKLDNENSYSYIHFHPIKIIKNSLLDFPRKNQSPKVASVHHQAVKKLGEDFEVIATSMDGKVIEAIHHKIFRNVYGIQFHTDFSELYDENEIFHIAPNNDYKVSKETGDFHRNFWVDFSKRLPKKNIYSYLCIIVF